MPKRRAIAILLALMASFCALPGRVLAAERTEIFYIPAITCGSKAVQAEMVLRQTRGVTGAVADVMEAAATVTWDDESVTLKDIMAALGRNGFPVKRVGGPPAAHDDAKAPLVNAPSP